MARGPDVASAASQGKGLPSGFRVYSPFPFAGMNLKDSPGAIADQEFVYCENFLKIGAARLRTAYDVGTAIYTAPDGLAIVSFSFFTIGTNYYVAIFLSDGSAVQVNTLTGENVSMGPAQTFYDDGNKQLPACQQWGTLYLLISNRNSVNDYWAWDGATLYTAGSAAPDGVVLASNGEGYDSEPSILAFGGHGHGMMFSSTVQAGGVVAVRITNPGTGYEVGDNVQLAFSGGGSDTSPQLVANLTAGTVAAANITAGGSNYTTATATFSGGGGSGAAGTPIISSGLSSIDVTNGGSGYTTGAVVSITGGGGTGATASAITIGGIVTEIDITDSGSGYTSPPTVTITGGGTGASASANITNGQIVGITITNPGSGYTSAPSIVIAGDGTGATAVAVLTPTSIDGVSVADGGTGFTYAPVLTFEGGGGTGASGVATLVGTSIAHINVISPGSGYRRPPEVSITGGGNGSGATAVAVLAEGQIIAVNVTNGGSGYTTNVQVAFRNKEISSNPLIFDPGSGAVAQAIFEPTTISGVIMSNYGQNYTDAPTVVVSPGANHSAYASVTMMPFGVSGSSMETFSSRLWILNPKQQPYATQPPGGDWSVSTPGTFTDFATSDGAVLFTNSDAFLQTRYVNVKQSNGYLYFFGDGSCSVVSSVNTSGSPATTTFNYQNVDPQGGLSWRDSQQDFGRTLLIANETGVYGLYGGALTKVSEKLDQLFVSALFPEPGTEVTTPTALAPSSAVATLFNVKHYLMLMTILDPDTGSPVNKMITWNEREWVVTSQTVDLTYIGSQKIESKLYAWGTDGTKLYPLFNRPSSNLIKRLSTKLYGADNPVMMREFTGLWVSAQDQSAGLSGVSCDVQFDISGVAVQTNPAAPNIDTTSVPNLETGGSGVDLLLHQPNFSAPPPFWPVFGTGTGGAPFMSLQAKLTTLSPDFILSHLALGYKDLLALFGGA